MEKLLNKKMDLLERVISILEKARSNVVQSVNSNMILAYWLVGREIIDEIQKGERRAEYGENILQDLSEKLNKRYKRGFSVPNLRNFRQFYLTYQFQFEKHYPMSSELDSEMKRYTTCSELSDSKGNNLHEPFFSQLSWSHYRALMRVKKNKARKFYEQEAVQCNWNTRTLERHIHSQYYERMLKNQKPEIMSKTALQKKIEPSIEILKNPYVLEFLDLPDSSTLHETELESAIITHLQSFLLELGKGFAFVGRQTRLHYENKEFYVDLVFYNCILKFYLLIDLKMGELSHKDVGQMDSYVRMFDDLFTVEDDNPTIGLILCTEKNETIAKYSVLNERKQIFASKYLLYLPTEKELQFELEK